LQAFFSYKELPHSWSHSFTPSRRYKISIPNFLFYHISNPHRFMHCGEHKTVVLVNLVFSLVTSAGFAQNMHCTLYSKT
jgi:hypothetical protein